MAVADRPTLGHRAAMHHGSGEFTRASGDQASELPSPDCITDEGSSSDDSDSDSDSDDETDVFVPEPKPQICRPRPLTGQSLAMLAAAARDPEILINLSTNVTGGHHSRLSNYLPPLYRYSRRTRQRLRRTEPRYIPGFRTVQGWNKFILPHGKTVSDLPFSFRSLREACDGWKSIVNQRGEQFLHHEPTRRCPVTCNYARQFLITDQDEWFAKTWDLPERALGACLTDAVRSGHVGRELCVQWTVLYPQNVMRYYLAVDGEERMYLYASNLLTPQDERPELFHHPLQVIGDSHETSHYDPDEPLWENLLRDPRLHRIAGVKRPLDATQYARHYATFEEFVNHYLVATKNPRTAEAKLEGLYPPTPGPTFFNDEWSGRSHDEICACGSYKTRTNYRRPTFERRLTNAQPRYCHIPSCRFIAYMQCLAVVMSAQELYGYTSYIGLNALFYYGVAPRHEYTDTPATSPAIRESMYAGIDGYSHRRLSTRLGQEPTPAGSGQHRGIPCETIVYHTTDELAPPSYWNVPYPKYATDTDHIRVQHPDGTVAFVRAGFSFSPTDITMSIFGSPAEKAAYFNARAAQAGVSSAKSGLASLAQRAHEFYVDNEQTVKTVFKGVGSLFAVATFMHVIYGLYRRAQRKPDPEDLDPTAQEILRAAGDDEESVKQVLYEFFQRTSGRGKDFLAWTAKEAAPLAAFCLVLQRVSSGTRSFTELWESGIKLVERFLSYICSSKVYVTSSRAERERDFTYTVLAIQSMTYFQDETIFASAGAKEAFIANYRFLESMQEKYTGNRAWSQTLNQVSRVLTQSQSILAQQTMHEDPTSKYPPLVIFFAGPPGSSKTTTSVDFIKEYGNFLREHLDSMPERLVYSRGPGSDQYWAGYRHEPIVQVDDFAQVRGTKGEDSTAEFFAITDNAIFRPKMAEVNEKATVAFASRIILMTSNQETPAPNNICTPSAIWRRFHVAITTTRNKNCSHSADGDPCDCFAHYVVYRGNTEGKTGTSAPLPKGWCFERTFTSRRLLIQRLIQYYAQYHEKVKETTGFDYPLVKRPSLEPFARNEHIHLPRALAATVQDANGEYIFADSREPFLTSDPRYPSTSQFQFQTSHQSIYDVARSGVRCIRGHYEYLRARFTAEPAYQDIDREDTDMDAVYGIVGTLATAGILGGLIYYLTAGPAGLLSERASQGEAKFKVTSKSRSRQHRDRSVHRLDRNGHEMDIVIGRRASYATSSDIIERVCQNVRHLWDRAGIHSSWGLQLGGQTVLTTKHFVSDLKGGEFKISSNPIAKEKDGQRINSGKCVITAPDIDDLSAINLNGMPFSQAGDITRHLFNPETDLDNLDWISKDGYHSVLATVVTFDRATGAKTVRESIASYVEVPEVDECFWTVGLTLARGDCGALLFTETKSGQAKLIGFLVAVRVNGHDAYFAEVDKKWIDVAMQADRCLQDNRPEAPAEPNAAMRAMGHLPVADVNPPVHLSSQHVRKPTTIFQNPQVASTSLHSIVSPSDSRNDGVHPLYRSAEKSVRPLPPITEELEALFEQPSPITSESSQPFQIERSTGVSPSETASCLAPGDLTSLDSLLGLQQAIRGLTELGSRVNTASWKSSTAASATGRTPTGESCSKQWIPFWQTGSVASANTTRPWKYSRQSYYHQKRSEIARRVLSQPCRSIILLLAATSYLAFVLGLYAIVSLMTLLLAWLKVCWIGIGCAAGYFATRITSAVTTLGGMVQSSPTTLKSPWVRSSSGSMAMMALRTRVALCCEMLLTQTRFYWTKLWPATKVILRAGPTRLCTTASSIACFLARGSGGLWLIYRLTSTLTVFVLTYLWLSMAMTTGSPSQISTRPTSTWKASPSFRPWLDGSTKMSQPGRPKFRGLSSSATKLSSWAGTQHGTTGNGSANFLKTPSQTSSCGKVDGLPLKIESHRPAPPSWRPTVMERSSMNTSTPGLQDRLQGGQSGLPSRTTTSLTAHGWRPSLARLAAFHTRTHSKLGSDTNSHTNPHSMQMSNYNDTEKNSTFEGLSPIVRASSAPSHIQTAAQMAIQAQPENVTIVPRTSQLKDTITDKASTAMELAGRSYRLKHIDWTVGTSVSNDQIPLLTLLEGSVDIQSLSRIVELYAYMRFDIELEFVVNATAFHQGLLVVGYHPTVDQTTSQGITKSNNQLFSGPHVELNASTSTTASMTIPFNNPRKHLQWGRIDRGALGYLIYSSVVDLSATDAASQSVSINVIATIKNVDVAGMVAPGDNSSPASGLLVRASNGCQVCRARCTCDSPEGTTTSVTTAKTQGSGIMDLLGNIPILGDIASTVGGAFEGAMSILPDLGAVAGLLDRPDQGDPPAHYRPTTAANFSSGTGKSDAYTLALTDNLVDQTANLPFKPITLKDFVMREGLFMNRPINMTADEGGVLGTVAVHPTLCVQPETFDYSSTLRRSKCLSGIPVAYHSVPYRYWRGGLRFRFKVVATSFVQAKIAITWRPATTSLDGPTGGWPAAAGFNMNWIWNVTGSQEYTVKIPFASETYFNEVSSYGYDFPGPIPTAYDKLGMFATTNGTLQLSFVNRPVSQSGAPATFQLLGFISGDEDFTLHQPVGISLVGVARPITKLALTPSAEPPHDADPTTWTSGATGGTFARASAGGDDGALQDEEIATQMHPTGQIDSVPEEETIQEPTNTMAPSAGVSIFGESHMDLSKTLARKQWIGRIQLDSPSTKNFTFGIPVNPAVRWRTSTDNGVVGTGWTSTDDKIPADFYHTLLSWHAAAASYWRGRLNFTFVYRGKGSALLSPYIVPIGGGTGGGSDYPEFDWADMAVCRRTGPQLPVRVYFAPARQPRDASAVIVSYRVVATNATVIQDTRVNPVVEVSVPWVTPLTYLDTSHDDTLTSVSTIDDTYTPTFGLDEINGILALRVDGEFSAEATDYIDCYISAGDDFKMAFHHYTPEFGVNYHS